MQSNSYSFDSIHHQINLKQFIRCYIQNIVNLKVIRYFHGLFILLPNRFPKNNKNNSKKKQIFMFRIQSEIIFCKKCVEIIGMNDIKSIIRIMLIHRKAFRRTTEYFKKKNQGRRAPIKRKKSKKIPGKKVNVHWRSNCIIF